VGKAFDQLQNIANICVARKFGVSDAAQDTTVKLNLEYEF